jgi:hypothetical protein
MNSANVIGPADSIAVRIASNAWDGASVIVGQYARVPRLGG